MIEATLETRSGNGFLRNLEAHAAQLGVKRGEHLKRIAAYSGHPWRSAASLWPNFGRE